MPCLAFKDDKDDKEKNKDDKTVKLKPIREYVYPPSYYTSSGDDFHRLAQVDTLNEARRRHGDPLAGRTWNVATEAGKFQASGTPYVEVKGDFEGDSHNHVLGLPSGFTSYPFHFTVRGSTTAEEINEHLRLRSYTETMVVKKWQENRKWRTVREDDKNSFRWYGDGGTAYCLIGGTLFDFLTTMQRDWEWMPNHGKWHVCM